MYYCQDCHMPYEQDICPRCGVKLPLIKEDDDCFLVEKKELWADMLKEVLENHHIPYYCAQLMGAGMSLKVGPMLESYQFYVPYSHYHEAMQCVETLFS
ncbi:hypothetical protein [Candidatus Stoquefichus massiliensis]|uniref:hypothetical protein n=1 Tax=Candidatus Stoquefichus massiliensis TaxID=1470350 RepID=UPI0004BA1FDC|nr:hypothetical protein [Candidatus Stoquefichus massiliensis]